MSPDEQKEWKTRLYPCEEILSAAYERAKEDFAPLIEKVAGRVSWMAIYNRTYIDYVQAGARAMVSSQQDTAPVSLCLKGTH